MLDQKIRYLQLAFNSDLRLVEEILPSIPFNARVFIEAGTPFIKKEGFKGVQRISELWRGVVVADLKTMDGALDEVVLAYNAGASAATVLGSAPIETINLFIKKCNSLNMMSMIDMIGIEEPMKILLKLKQQPSVVILHKGRDEESSKKVIPYKQVNKIRSKYDVSISAAGGVDLREARSAIFNGANVVVVNVVKPEDSWTGIRSDGDIVEIVNEFLKTIE